MSLGTIHMTTILLILAVPVGTDSSRDMRELSTRMVVGRTEAGSPGVSIIVIPASREAGRDWLAVRSITPEAMAYMIPLVAHRGVGVRVRWRRCRLDGGGQRQEG